MMKLGPYTSEVYRRLKPDQLPKNRVAFSLKNTHALNQSSVHFLLVRRPGVE